MPSPSSATERDLLLERRRESGAPGNEPKKDLAPGSLLGFRRRSAFVLWLLLGSAAVLFSIAQRPWRTGDSAISTHAVPGEWFWFHQHWYNVGLKLHIGTVVPCFALSVLQFIPLIRQRWILLHRFNGYVVLKLSATSLVGSWMITNRSLGGDISAVTSLATLGIVTFFSGFMGYINIKRLQIDQHRKWTIRWVAFMGTSITVRFLGGSLAMWIPSWQEPQYKVWRCDELAFTMDVPNFLDLYPSCAAANSSISMSQLHTPVRASLETPANFGTAVRVVFGSVLWLLIVLHGAAAEAYIGLTSAESDRLRKVSHQRQLQAGMVTLPEVKSDRLGGEEPWRAT